MFSSASQASGPEFAENAAVPTKAGVRSPKPTATTAVDPSTHPSCLASSRNIPLVVVKASATARLSSELLTAFLARTLYAKIVDWYFVKRVCACQFAIHVAVESEGNVSQFCDR